MPARIPALTPHIEGPATGDSLFFVQGWPDDHTLWNDQVLALRDRYRCVRVDLPNYPQGERRRWGFDHEEIAESLAQCIRSVSPTQPVTLIAHDWGAYWAFLMHHRHPALVSRLVGLDVAPSVKPKLYELPLIAGYQLWLSAAFVSGGPVGAWMTRGVAALLDAPQRGKAIDASLNYPYFYTWRDIVVGRRSRLLRGYRPEVPVLYVFGARKPVRFHSERWLEYVQSRPANAVVRLANTGHWVMKDPEFTRVLYDWLDTTGRNAH
jgi:pimeloyl-ACP methyl ester carboxylesterase